MVEIEAYKVRIIKYISMNKQSTPLTNIFRNTISGVVSSANLKGGSVTLSRLSAERLKSTRPRLYPGSTGLS